MARKVPRKLRIGHVRALRMSGDVGAYAIAGQAAALRRAALLTAAQGAYAVSGQSATLTASDGEPPPVSEDFATRRSGANVVAWQGFDYDAEVTQFAQAQDADLNAVALYREADPIVGSCLVFKFIGAKLAANFLASGGNGPRTMVLDDASEWPTTFPFRFFVSKLPDAGADTKTLFSCTARTGNNLTVTYVPLGVSEFDSGASFTDRFIGDAAGSECQNYVRPFSALTGTDNGKGTNDPAASGTLPVRSRIVGNPSYVPQTPSLFGYGFCAHNDYLADARYSPWVPNYQGTGLGDSTSRANVIDTNELFIQYRLWIDNDATLADMVGGKLFGIQVETTVPQQIVTGHGPGAGSFSIPSTAQVPFALAKFNHGTYGSAGMTMAANPYSPNGSSYQPGSYDPVTGKSWEATAIHATSNLPSVGQDTPDGSSAWEYKTGRWVTFQWRIKPGKNWHYSVPLKNTWDSASQSSLTLLDAPDDWPTSSFQIAVEFSSSVFNVASRSGAVLSGITLASGSHVTMAAQDSRWILTSPSTPAGATALSTLLEVKFADFGDTQYTTLFSDNDHPIQYGSRGQYPHYFDQSIPGFNAAVLWGYHNSALSVSSAPYKTLHQKFAQLIISKASIDPPNDLPTWVPAPGEVATLTVANGGLTNHYRDVIDPYYSAFHAIKSVNAYSGATKNPYWGNFGATIFFGGGHADTNHNAVIIQEYGPTALTHKRAVSATPWFGTGTDAATKDLNGAGTPTNHLMDLSYMDALVDGKPGAPHSYGVGDVVGPEYGGAIYGTLVHAISAAVNRQNDYGALAAHQLPFNNLLTGALATNAWARESLIGTSLAGSGAWAAPPLTAFVGPQQRVYIQTRTNGPPMRWYNRTTRAHVNGTGVAFEFPLASGFDSGIMFYVPSRSLLVCMWPQGGVVRLQYMSVADMTGLTALPSLTGPNSGTATLSAAPAIANPWSAACWCPHNNRILMIGVTGDNAAAYEIEIPATLTSNWTVTRAPFGAGQTIDDEGSTYTTGKKWHYDERVRAIVYTRTVSDTGADQVKVYRPRNT